MGQAAVRGDPQKYVDGLVRSGSRGQTAAGSKEPSRIGFKRFALRGRVCPLINAVDLEPTRHWTLSREGSTLSQLLAQFFDIHAERILRSDGNVEIQHAGAPQEALQVFGVIKHGAQGCVGVVVHQRGVDLSRRGWELRLELRYCGGTVFALLGQLWQYHNACPATGGERAGLHLGALFVVRHLGSCGSFSRRVKISALLACSDRSVIRSATVARRAPK